MTTTTTTNEFPSPTFPHKYLFKECGPKTTATKKKKGLCKHWGCQKYSRGNARDCNTCHTRKRRMRNPVRYAYEQLQDSARKRHIPFTLTFDQFVNFDQCTGYVASKGKESESLTVDRIQPHRGYEFDNIRVLTWTENCSRKIDGLTDPVEPIAIALCFAAGGTNWHSFKCQAVEVLHQVELLLNHQEDQFVDDNYESDENPF